MNLLFSFACRKLLVLPCFIYSWAMYAQQPATLSAPPVKPDTLLSVPVDTLPKTRPAIIDSSSYRFIGDGNFTRGNVNRSLLVLRAEITLQGPAVNISTNPRFTYGKQNRLLAERDTYVDLIVDVFKKRKVYVFGLATIERSNLRRIDWRRLAGAGIGFRLVQKEHHHVSLTNAIIYESTDFQERPTLSTVRNSARLKGRHSFLEDRMRLTHITFVQPALNDFSNLRWNTLITLEIPLNQWITIRGSFENSYESVVEATRQNNDSRVTFGIAIGNRQ